MDREQLIDRVSNALREAGRPVLRADHVARVLEIPTDRLLNQLRLLEEMQAAGLGPNPIQIVPWNRRKAYGVDFEKVLASVKKKADGSKTRSWQPGIMLRSAEQELRLACIRKDAGELITLQRQQDGFLEQYDVSFNANGIMLTWKSPNVQETPDTEPSQDANA
jgi:hypothetical protein